MITNLTTLQYAAIYLLAIAITIFILKNNFLFFFVAIEILFLAINLLWILYSLKTQDINGSGIALSLIALAAIDAAIGLSLLLQYFSISLSGKIQLSELRLIKG